MPTKQDSAEQLEGARDWALGVGLAAHAAARVSLSRRERWEENESEKKRAKYIERKRNESCEQCEQCDAKAL